MFFKDFERTFRAKKTDENTGGWVYGMPCGNVMITDAQPDHITTTAIDKSTITAAVIGVLDTKKKQVYEGDRVQVPEGYKGTVRYGYYSPNSGDLTAYNIGFYIDWDTVDGHKLWLRQDLGFWYKENRLTIIGNIFDR